VAASSVLPDAFAGLRGDALPIAVGVFLAGVGVVVGLLALAFWRSRDRAPLWFSLFTTGYGIRLATSERLAQLLLAVPPAALDLLDRSITYTIPIPFVLFLEEMIGPGWHRSIRRLWQVHLVFVLIALPVETVRGTPWAFGGVYRWLIVFGTVIGLVHIYWPGSAASPELRRLRISYLILSVFILHENLRDVFFLPRMPSVEWLGFLIFFGALGFIAADRLLGAERRLSAIRQELETARRIQASILPAEVPRLPGLEVAVRYVPAAEVAGDYYDFLPAGDGLGLLVADVSGHGVPAALIAAMVKIAVGAQAAEAASPARLLTGMSRIFYGKLKNQFITAAYLYADPRAGRFTYASAGHPPPLHWQAAETRVVELRQGGLVLGRLARAEYREAEVPMAPGDRVLLFTDGIPEARNRAGEALGDERLRAFLAGHAGLRSEALATALLARIVEWTGRREGFEDDLTLIVLGVD